MVWSTRPHSFAGQVPPHQARGSATHTPWLDRSSPIYSASEISRLGSLTHIQPISLFYPYLCDHLFRVTSSTNSPYICFYILFQQDTPAMPIDPLCAALWQQRPRTGPSRLLVCRGSCDLNRIARGTTCRWSAVSSLLLLDKCHLIQPGVVRRTPLGLIGRLLSSLGIGYSTLYLGWMSATSSSQGYCVRYP
jgi:hypothetical protein